MRKREKATRLAREGYDLWHGGRLEEAIGRYSQALELADPEHHGLPDYHGEFALVLEAVGNTAEARRQLELAVETARRHHRSDRYLEVAMARYFLAEHLVRTDYCERALQVLEPSLAGGCDREWLLRAVQAEALWQLGRPADARRAADLAVTVAPTGDPLTTLTERLAGIRSDPEAG